MSRTPVIFDNIENDSNYISRTVADQLYINVNEPYSSNLNMAGNKITNLADGVNDNDAVTMKQLRTFVSDDLIKVKLGIVEGTVGQFRSNSTTPLFAYEFLHAILVFAEFFCFNLDETPYERWVSISDPVIKANFNAQVKIENNRFILTLGQVTNRATCISSGAYKITYIYFRL